MKLNYNFGTPEHNYVIEPDPTVHNLVTVQSPDREAIEEVLDTIALAGVAEGENFDHLTIEEDMTAQEPYFYVEISTATLALWWSFEALNFIGAVPVPRPAWAE